MRALVTGATGFIGTHVVRILCENGVVVRGTTRSPQNALQSYAGYEPVCVGDMSGAIDWRAALDKIDVLIHLAARAHILHDSVADPAAAYWKVNVQATEQLVQAAADAGVRRIIFVSSAKVNGEATHSRSFTEDDQPSPCGLYARSKFEAETRLRTITQAKQIESVIVRPALVYGPGVRANFLHLIRCVDKDLPLPFASVDNLRSMIGVHNLADLLYRCIWHPGANGQLFLASDGNDLSTADWVRQIAVAFRKTPRLFRCSPTLLRVVASCMGQRPMMSRLLDSLRIDITKARQTLDWTPPHSVQEGMSETVYWYKSTSEHELPTA